jgi:hypothetical protein
LFWVCNVASLGVGVGLLLGWRWLNAAGALLLLVGTPAWFVNLFFEGTFLPTSLLPHWGGLVFGLIGLRQLGPPQGDWWKALAILAVLFLISPGVTAKADNVNFVYGIWPQTAPWWPLPGPRVLPQLAVWAIALGTLESCLRRARVFKSMSP